MDTKEINAAVKCAVETTQQPPSFFIHGSSVFALETEAVNTAETLKTCFFAESLSIFQSKCPIFRIWQVRKISLRGLTRA